MKSKIEIERKWVLFELPECNSKLREVKKEVITQFYTTDGYRYRDTQDNMGNHIYERIKKIKVADGVNNETEIEEITQYQYIENRKRNPSIQKTRRTYEAEGSPLNFEVDDYSPIRLMILEVEIPSIDFVFGMPPNIMEQILKEVTGDDAYSNKQLAIKISGRKWLHI